MSWWTIAVYSLAALWGVRMLFTLMIQHRRRHLQQLMDQETARQEAEPETAAAVDSVEKPERPAATGRKVAA